LKFYTVLLLFILFAWPAYAEQIETAIMSQTLVKSTQSWDGSQLPAYPEGQPEVTILKVTIPVGVVLPFHKHPYINAGVLTKGELTVVSKAGKKLTMKAGDPIVELVDNWHFGENLGNVPAEIIVFYAGIKGQPITIK
jgi:quercetin dioxygenase-like cupin family protein